MVTLETLMNAAQKERLMAAIPRRYACRSYAGEITLSDWAALSYAAGRYLLPGARLHLLRVSESLFTGTLLNMGRVVGCKAVAVVVAASPMKRSRMNAGILGEALCLEAVSMGLGCCWISGSYRKKYLQIPLAPGEAVLAVIALGPPAKETDQPPTRRRKSLERLCRGNLAEWPEDARRMAEAVREAPSAMNMQPWTIALEPTRLLLNAPDRAQLDLGIGLCHAEIACAGPHTWHFAKNRKDPAAWVAR